MIVGRAGAGACGGRGGRCAGAVDRHHGDRDPGDRLCGGAEDVAAFGRRRSRADASGGPQLWRAGQLEREIGDTVGIQVSAQAWANVVPMLERDGVDVVVVRINSGGGVLVETLDFFDVFQQQYKPRFRTVAWVESAIAEAAMATWCLDEFYMMPQGHIGVCSCWRKGWNVEDALRLMDSMSDAAKRDREIMRAMLNFEPLSCDIDPATGDVTWHQSEEGDHLVNPPGRILTFNAGDAVKYKFAPGVAATREELAQAMGLADVEWAGQAAGDHIDESMRDADRTDKRLGEIYTRYAAAIREAAAARDKHVRSASVDEARRLLDLLRRWISVNPNFAHIYPMGDDWFQEQEEKLRELETRAWPREPGAYKPPERDQPERASDRILFRDGRQINGDIVELHPDRVRILVSKAGMSADVTYERSEIAHLRWDGAWIGDPPPDVERDRDGDAATWDDGVTVVYTIPLTGEIRTCCAATPMRRMIEEAREHRADILLVTIDMDDERGLVRTYEEAIPIYDDLHHLQAGRYRLREFVREHRSWRAKPRLLFQVRRARGASAFLPLLSQEIWFAPDAVLGSSAPLTLLPEVDYQPYRKRHVRRLHHATTMALEGGHASLLAFAMADEAFTASFSIIDGEPVFYDSLHGDFLLTDDGQDERRDTLEDVAAGRVNDILWMDAELARQIGFSRGTVATIEEVLERAGVGGPVRVVDGGGIIAGWREELAAARPELAALLEEFGQIEVEGDYYDRTAARASQIRMLKKIKTLLDRVGEAIDVYELGNVPDNWNTNVEVMIQQVRNRQLADQPELRGRDGRRSPGRSGAASEAGPRAHHSHPNLAAPMIAFHAYFSIPD